jgi:hypothetical protein
VLALDVSKALFVADRGHDVNSFVLLLDKSPSLSAACMVAFRG